MSGIPSKCPKCGRTKEWKEIVNPSGAGIPTRFGRVRTGIIVKGLFAKPIKRALGFYKVTYRCHRCGFRQEYELPN
jgi:uncharacterized protein (DUF983 family)